MLCLEKLFFTDCIQFEKMEQYHFFTLRRRVKNNSRKKNWPRPPSPSPKKLYPIASCYLKISLQLSILNWHVRYICSLHTTQSILIHLRTLFIISLEIFAFWTPSTCFYYQFMFLYYLRFLKYLTCQFSIRLDVWALFTWHRPPVQTVQ